MSLYEFLSGLSFWQWIGVLCLASIVCLTIEAVFVALVNATRKP